MNATFFQTLKHIALTHRRKLASTFSMVALENLLYITYPYFAAFAINAVIAQNLLGALGYAALVLFIWLVGAYRRRLDTQTFTRIYAELVVPVIVKQRADGEKPSSIVARVALSREFVDFFETHLPIFLSSAASLLGATVMLLVLELWIGVLAAVILAVFCFLVPKFSRGNERLYFRLNNRLEKEVDIIHHERTDNLHRHYHLLSKLRTAISNREAAGFLMIGLSAAILLGFALSTLTIKGYNNAGQIYAVTTYLWMFAMSLDDAPSLLEQYAKLNDIGSRVESTEQN